MLMSEAPLFLPHWTDFYVIVGSSAGALTGLQFVVIALIAEAEAARSMKEIRAFGTPTIVHFCVALLISAIAAAPWHALLGPAVCLAICGAGGVAYSLRVIGHARAQTGYAPDTEDWFWYAAAPLFAYFILFSTAVALMWFPGASLFVVAGTTLLLLFIGIHNAWDTVTYIAVQRWPKTPDDQKQN
jgi:hypothetical protein